MEIIRHNPSKTTYLSPEAELLAADYDCLIAESPLEGVNDGDEWTWED
ncbi:MAG: hypothetical protein IJU68_05560 [Bacteroidales bacterium]|nr:hypothetical protein [Bacteroidales bacterium]